MMNSQKLYRYQAKYLKEHIDWTAGRWPDDLTTTYINNWLEGGKDEEDQIMTDEEIISHLVDDSEKEVESAPAPFSLRSKHTARPGSD